MIIYIEKNKIKLKLKEIHPVLTSWLHLHHSGDLRLLRTSHTVNEVRQRRQEDAKRAGTFNKLKAPKRHLFKNQLDEALLLLLQTPSLLFCFFQPHISLQNPIRQTFPDPPFLQVSSTFPCYPSPKHPTFPFRNNLFEKTITLRFPFANLHKCSIFFSWATIPCPRY